eukprot:644449-Pelagomonas_calceolata.AAC.1
MPALKQHNSSNGGKVSIRQWCSSATSNQPISMQPIGYCTSDTNLYASHSQPDTKVTDLGSRWSGCGWR